MKVRGPQHFSIDFIYQVLAVPRDTSWKLEVTLSLLSLYWDTSGKNLKQIKLHALNIVKVELIVFASETPIAFNSFRKTNIATLIHVNVNHATVVPVKKIFLVEQILYKIRFWKKWFHTNSAVKLGFNSNRYGKEKWPVYEKWLLNQDR